MMPKFNLTSLVTIFGSAALLAAAGLSTAIGDQARAQNAQISRNERELPETKKLQQNDNLEPTLNRTQAMRMEAETGSLAPINGSPISAAPARPKQSPLTRNKVSPKKIIHVY